MRILRNLIVIILILLAIGLLLYVWRPALLAGAQPSLPVDLVQLIPKNWTVLQNRSTQCDFDLDPAADLDWLVIYRYDRGQIGGLVFATQINRVPQQPGQKAPYRPAFLVPYKLLPDIYEGKGQGYLGDADVAVRFWPAPVNGQPCQAQELTIFGSNGAHFNRISIFRWNAAASQFDGVHFAGSARIDPAPEPAGSPQLVTAITTYDTFNDRSALCEVHAYQRAGGPQPPPASLQFTENTSSYTIDFCYGAPTDPAYPEAVVVALLRRPDLPGAGNPVGTGHFLSPSVQSGLPKDLAPMQATGGWSAYRILTVKNQGVLANLPGPGTVIASSQGGNWWVGTDQAVVQTTVVLPDGRQADFTWYLVSVANEQVVTDTRWRVVKVQ